jgi:hypothetical protein
MCGEQIVCSTSNNNLKVVKKMKTAIVSAIMILAIPIIVLGQIQLGQNPQKTLPSNVITSKSLSFTENRGQWDAKVLFRAEAGGAVFFFCRDEVDYMFTRKTDQLEKSPMVDIPDKFDRVRYKREAILIKASFIGANQEAEISGENQLSKYSNYFTGDNPDKWQTRVPSYSSITYKDIYPGIDLKYYGNGQSMKYDFIVAPGADISMIQIRYEGVDGLNICNDGSLSATTSFGPVYEQTPIIYQEIDGQRREISGRYIIKEAGAFGFAIDNGYNPTLPITIDPELVYSTYLGGNDDDWGNAMAVDYDGYAYIVGETQSSDFPIVNPYQPSIFLPYSDIFLTKLTPDGAGIVYSTYLGGSDGEIGMAVALDNAGFVYLTGYSNSRDYPVVNPFQTYQGVFDIVVTKLVPTGDSLVYSTYLGDAGTDLPYSMAVDKNGCAYLTGTTNSTNFPMKNPLMLYQGNNEAFVTKFAPTGDSLIYSTYLSGSNVDHGYAIAVDKDDQAYIAGYTYSIDFPTLYSNQEHQYVMDAFVTKLNPTGSAIRYSTFLGGDFEDKALAMALDDQGYVYVTGYTSSSDFPTLNPYQTHQGNKDIFVVKLAPTRCLIEYSTYLGGNQEDWGWGIAVDKMGNAYVTGFTESTNFPTLDPFQQDQEYYDAYLTKLGPAGNELGYSTYLGGSESDYGYAVALDGNDNVYVMGSTYSPDFPLLNPYQTNQGSSDIFVMKFANTTGVDEEETSLPRDYLMGYYPNPFNSSTLINYQIDTRALVSLSIYNLLGQRVATLCEKYQEPGIYSAIWDAKGVSSGVYLCRLEIGDKSEYSKMVLMK